MLDQWNSPNQNSCWPIRLISLDEQMETLNIWICELPQIILVAPLEMSWIMLKFQHARCLVSFWDSSYYSFSLLPYINGYKLYFLSSALVSTKTSTHCVCGHAWSWGNNTHQHWGLLHSGAGQKDPSGTLKTDQWNIPVFICQVPEIIPLKICFCH